MIINLDDWSSRILYSCKNIINIFIKKIFIVSWSKCQWKINLYEARDSENLNYKIGGTKTNVNKQRKNVNRNVAHVFATRIIRRVIVRLKITSTRQPVSQMKTFQSTTRIASSRTVIIPASSDKCYCHTCSPNVLCIIQFNLGLDA